MRSRKLNLASGLLAVTAIAGGLAAASCSRKQPAPTAENQPGANSLANPEGLGFFKPVDAMTCLSVKPHTAPAGQPVDDVSGVRPGMSPAEVARVLGCSDKSLVASASNKGTVPDELLPPHDKPISSLLLEYPPGENFLEEKKDQNTYTARFAGLKGREALIQIVRSYNVYGTPILLSAMTADLKKKYGEPSVDNSNRSGLTSYELWWIFDSEGRPMSDKNPALVGCEWPGSASSTCGAVIHAVLTVENQGEQALLSQMNLISEQPFQENAAIAQETAALKAQTAAESGPAPKL